ncbi:MAG: DUF1203 domain-containing protein [Deltaproteobacteria bacterium]|nr:DUF1203 domain-containing protein [Deltaproteobacteria bacterium]
MPTDSRPPADRRRRRREIPNRLSRPDLRWRHRSKSSSPPTLAHGAALREVGPIFLHPPDLPRLRSRRAAGTVRLHGAGHRPGLRRRRLDPLDRLGRVGARVASASRAILADPKVAYVHVRSKFNCFQCRIERN